MKNSRTCFSCARWNGSCLGKVSIKNKDFSTEEYTCDNWFKFTCFNKIVDWITEMIQLGQREPE